MYIVQRRERAMGKHAFVRWWGRLDGQRRHATLRMGKKGHGYLLAEAWFYPDDEQSKAEARALFSRAAKREGVEVIGSDWHDRPATRRSARAEREAQAGA
jgi:hypothetical protein